METTSIQRTSFGGEMARMQAPTRPAAVKGVAEGFTDAVKKAVLSVDNQQDAADESVEKLLTGRTGNIHEVVGAVAKADLSFKLLLQTRNKLVDAYKATMNIQV